MGRRERDIERFERLWERHYGEVLAYARRRSGDEVATEVAAEVFTVAWRRLDEVPHEPRGWLLGVARRVLANQRRGEGRRLRLLERLRGEAARPPIPAPPASSEAPVLRALARLTAKEREALMLVAWEGLGQPEAAEAAGCSQGAFRVRLHRARRRLADELEARDGVSSGLGAGRSVAAGRGG